MAASNVPLAARLRQAVSPLSHPQHRDAAYLVLNLGAQAAAGLLFWLVLTRWLHLEAEQVGIGYSVIALGTLAAVVAKGGLDTALLRHVPGAGRQGADALLRLATSLGAAVALAVCLLLYSMGAWPELRPLDWLLAGAIAVLLMTTWMQDALFLAEGHAKASALRNLASSCIRVVLPLAFVAIAVPRLVASSWAVALAAGAAIGMLAHARLPYRDGRPVARRAFLGSATRNVAGSAAEFLPGLLLAPLVLAMQGAEAAAHFGIAWTIASMLFLASSACSRSALATLVGQPAARASAIRRAVAQHVALLVPAALLMVVLARVLLGVFGADYAEAATLPLALLALSILPVAPATIYLSLLRAQDATRPLMAFPLALLALLAVLAPLLGQRWGLTGIAAAWLLANLPVGAWAAWRLHQVSQEVNPDAPATLRGPAHVE